LGVDVAIGISWVCGVNNPLRDEDVGVALPKALCDSSLHGVWMDFDGLVGDMMLRSGISWVCGVINPLRGEDVGVALPKALCDSSLHGV
jgi:hypothetical protein